MSITARTGTRRTRGIDTQARFAHLTGGVEISSGNGQGIEPIGSSQVRHPTDGSLMVKVDGSVYQSGPSNEPVWVPAYYIDVHPVSNAEYARFIAATGREAPRHWDDGKYPATAQTIRSST